ncbi:MAG: xylulokinase [Clostridia bacterium]|nr:xylulokinase [Clostridia bacterium]
MKYYIGADLGTSSVKLILCDADGEIVKTVTKYYDVSYPHPGWSEQSPSDWWNAFSAGVKELAEGIDGICGISVAGQMHGLVILDKDDNVIRPAILWNDGRTFAETEYLNTVIGKQKLSEHTANIAFAGFTAPKILWVKNNEPENFARIAKIMLPKDYINYRITKVHATEYSDAAGMLLLDVKNKCWSKEMLDICSIDESKMPELFESYECIGTVSSDVAKKLGLSQNVKVIAGAADNAAAAIGTGTVGNGKCNISLGTSGTVVISSDKFSVDANNSLHAFCHADGGYYLMGCMLSAASCNKWFCEEVLETEDFAAEQAAITEDMLGNNNVYFLPYLMGERCPVNDTNASGMFIGLRPDSTRADMLQAVLEGVAFAIRDNVEVAKSLGINIERSTVCGGGARSELWLKIISNVLNIELQVPMAEEGPSLGAARLAMVGCGEYASVAECATVEIKNTVKPDKMLAERYEKKYKKFKEIYPNTKELFRTLMEENK